MSFFEKDLDEDNQKIEVIESTWFVTGYLDEKWEKYKENYIAENNEEPPALQDITEKDRVNDSLILALSGNDIEKFGEYCENYALSKLFEFYLLRQAYLV